MYGCCFKIGDLVEYRTWYDGNGGWISVEGQIGVVLEIIEISYDDADFNYIPSDEPLYDIRVYWYTDGTTETLPDLLLDIYNSKARIKF